jgi:hypothetical protein
MAQLHQEMSNKADLCVKRNKWRGLTSCFEKNFSALAEPDGRKLHWISDIDEEIPIPMKTSASAVNAL